jgi:hypothetical protein
MSAALISTWCGLVQQRQGSMMRASYSLYPHTIGKRVAQVSFEAITRLEVSNEAGRQPSVPATGVEICRKLNSVGDLNQSGLFRVAPPKLVP